MLGWILHRAEQQVFVGRNSDTWMRTVRLLIRDSASPLSPHLGRRGDAQTHTHTHTSARAHSQIRVHSRWPLISRTNQSRQSQKQFSRKRSDPLEKCKSVCWLEKFTIVFFPSLGLFVNAAPLLRTQHFCRRVTNRRIKTNVKVTVASVTVASGVRRAANSLGRTEHMAGAPHERGVNWWESLCCQ